MNTVTTPAATPATALNTFTGANTTANLIARDQQLASLGEELGVYKPYDSQMVLADITGTRAVKCLYRTDPKKPASQQNQSVYVRVPTKHLTEELVTANIAELAPYVTGWLQGLEDTIIKEQHKRGQLSVYTESLSIDALIEYLEETQESGRLTKDKIGAWFDTDIADNLSLLFADKMGLSDQPSDIELAKLAAIIGAYKGKFCALASGKAFFEPSDREALIKVIHSCEAASSNLGSRFIARLSKMTEKKVEELLLSL